MANPSAYPLFEHWYKTNIYIMERCERMPKNTRFTISNKIASLSLDVVEKIIEAIYSKNKREHLIYINLVLEKLRVFFRICKDKNYISIKQYQYVTTEINTAGKMCGGWLNTIT